MTATMSAVRVSRALAVIVAAVFAFGVAMKLDDPFHAINDIASTGAWFGHTFSTGFLELSLRIVVALETATVFLLVAPSGERLGAALSILLLIAYSVLLACKSIAFGRTAECGCLPWLGASSVRLGLVRNVALIVASGFVYFVASRHAMLARRLQ